MITYPRKCTTCDHVANNPAMWHYHRKIHEPIPPETLCQGGCGQHAEHRNTNGRYTCTKIAQQCPGYIEQHSARVKQQWNNNAWTERRRENRERTQRETTAQRQARNEKQRQTKFARLLAVENTLEKRQYSRIVIYHSRKTYDANYHLVNPDNFPISRRGYHLEHKVSRHVGFLLQIPIQYMCSVANLCVLDEKKNATKGPKCTLHPVNLLEQCHASDQEIRALKTKVNRLPQLNTLLPKGSIK